MTPGPIDDEEIGMNESGLPSPKLARAAIVLLAVTGAPLSAQQPPPRAPFVTPRCPAAIAVDQRLREPLPGWREHDVAPRGHHIRGIAVFAGPVVDRAQLKPDQSIATRGIRLARYELGGDERWPTHVACGYDDTDVVVTVTLPTGLRDCTEQLVPGTRTVDRGVLLCRYR